MIESVNDNNSVVDRSTELIFINSDDTLQTMDTHVDHSVTNEAIHNSTIESTLTNDDTSGNVWYSGDDEDVDTPLWLFSRQVNNSRNSYEDQSEFRIRRNGWILSPTRREVDMWKIRKPLTKH